jgi:hypothetical protein
VSPRRAAPVLVVALLVAGCTSEPSPAERSSASQAAKQQAVAHTDMSKAVTTIKQCVRDGDGEYPPAVKKQGGTITMLCGPMGRSIQLTHGNRLSYTPKRGGFTVEIITAAGATVSYDSKTGKTTKS